MLLSEELGERAQRRSGDPLTGCFSRPGGRGAYGGVVSVEMSVLVEVQVTALLDWVVQMMSAMRSQREFGCVELSGVGITPT